MKANQNGLHFLFSLEQDIKIGLVSLFTLLFLYL